MKGSPHLGPVKAPPHMTSQASPMQRAMMSRQQAARTNSTSSSMPPLQPVNTMVSGQPQSAFSSSQVQYPSNNSPSSSPSASRSPGYSMQGGMTSPASTFPNQQMHQQPHTSQPRPQRSSFSHHQSDPRAAPGQLNTPPASMPGKTPLQFSGRIRLHGSLFDRRVFPRHHFSTLNFALCTQINLSMTDSGH